MSALFQQFGAIAVSYAAKTSEQLYAGSGDEPVYWRCTAVSALFDESIDLDILLACVRKRIGTENILGKQVEKVADRNWADAHKDGRGDLIFAGNLCIRPSWVEADTDYPTTLILDPGLAFGSGRHATTALCLDWLARHDLQAKLLIDYGCGSGVLALAAAKLGAKTVHAVDIDPQALVATAANARRNNLQHKLKVAAAADAVLPCADILMANILLNPLLNLAPLISELVREGGKLVLSGLLAVQVEECLSVYRSWFNMGAPVFQDEWALLEGTRAAN